jgi:hypothetical protein
MCRVQIPDENTEAFSYRSGTRPFIFLEHRAQKWTWFCGNTMRSSKE